MDSVLLVSSRGVAENSAMHNLMLSPEELANGADDNGNDLVDEGQLLYTDLTTGESVALCQNLGADESIFAWDSTTVTIANIGQIASDESIYRIARSLAMVPRN